MPITCFSTLKPVFHGNGQIVLLYVPNTFTMYSIQLKVCILFVACAGILSSCQKQPTASFTASDDYVEIGEAIEFTNTSSDAESYEWDFGDGFTSSITDASHSYGEPGTYEVTLTAYSKKEKKSDSESMTVSVAAPNDRFIGEYSVTASESSTWCGDQSGVEGIYTIKAGAGDESVLIDGFAGGRLNNVKGEVEGNEIYIPMRDTANPGTDGETWRIFATLLTLSDDRQTLTVNYRIDDLLGSFNCGEIVGTGSGTRLPNLQ